MANFSKGEKIVVTPSGTAYSNTPATKWLKKKQVVTLLEDAFSGGWDVFDVETKTGKNESIYGFNIKAKSRAKPTIRTH